MYNQYTSRPRTQQELHDMAHHRFHKAGKCEHTVKSDLTFHRNGAEPLNA